jgi:integrase
MKEMLQASKWRQKTEADHKAQLALFLEIVTDRPINEVGFAEVRRYKEALTRLPPNRSKIAQYRDLSIDALLELKDTTPMALNTINKALTRVLTFLNWAVRHGYVSQNYAQGLALPNPKRDDEERDHWSHEDLRRLFSSDSYNEKRRYRHTYMFWLPILGLFTGACLEEICQLHLSDIYPADGIWVIDINDAVSKKVKTKSSRRLIPLHPILGDIGFIKYVERLKSFGKKRLFEELTRHRDGYGQYASRWFARYKVQCGIKIGDHEKKDFRSFRKTLSKVLLNVETPYGFIADILGHEKPGETVRYTGRANPKLLLEWLSKVDFKLSFGSYSL